MIFRIRCHLALVMMMFRPLVSDTRNQYYDPFCVHTKSAFGRTQCSFLQRSTATQSFLLYWTSWTIGHQVEECFISADPALIQHYIQSCREERTRNSNLTRFNISLVLEPDSPCKFRPSAVNTRMLHIRNQTGARTRQKRSWILPGTLWCGRGSSAKDYGQLGMFQHADGCCREHDHCRHIIRPFTVNYGMFNPSPFTISHCDCDHRFKQCLLNVNDSVSNMVGYSFFNILKLRCFKLIQKKHCTQLNWCTSVQVAPFAKLKNPKSYNLKHSNSGIGDISNPPSFQNQHSANGKNIKPKRRQRPSKTQRNNATISPRVNAFLMSDKIQQLSNKTKKLSPGTVLPTRSPTVHQKNQTPPKMKTIHQSELMNHITPPPESAKNTSMHTTASWAKGFSAQKPFVTLLKKNQTNKNRTKYKNLNFTVNMSQNQKPLTSKPNCDSIVSPRDCNFQSTQQKGKDWMMDKVSNLKSLSVTQSPKLLKTSLAGIFPQTNTFFGNKTQPVKKTSRKNASNKQIVSEHPKQKVKNSLLKNKLTTNKLTTNMTREHKSRNPAPVKPTLTTEPRNTLRKDILSPKISVGFQKPSSTKQEAVSSTTKNVKKKCKASSNSFTVNNASVRMTTTSRSIPWDRNEASSAQTTTTFNSSVWNESNSTFEETGSTSICDAVRYLDGKYRIQPLETINGRYNKQSNTMDYCDCLYRLTKHLKQHKRERKNILQFLLGNFVSISCIETPNMNECNKAIGYPAVLSKTTGHNSSLTKMDKDLHIKVTLKHIKQLVNKKGPARLYKRCLGILNPRNPNHVKKNP